MDGYENLSFREASLLWDRIRPDQEMELVLDELYRRVEAETREPEPCDLYDKCWECPNFSDCVGVVAIPDEMTREKAA